MGGTAAGSDRKLRSLFSCIWREFLLAFGDRCLLWTHPNSYIESRCLGRGFGGPEAGWQAKDWFHRSPAAWLSPPRPQMTVGSPLPPAAHRRLPQQRLLDDGAVTGWIGAGVSDGTPGVEEWGREGVGKGKVSAGRALGGPSAAPSSSGSSTAASTASVRRSHSGHSSSSAKLAAPRGREQRGGGARLSRAEWSRAERAARRPPPPPRRCHHSNKELTER